jgi:hypothetical protein
MTTLSDNIMDMAKLVRDVKDATRLSENTILRLIDMNLSLMLNARPTNPLQIVEADEPTTEETE